MIRAITNTLLLILVIYLYIEPKLNGGDFTPLGFEKGNTIMLWTIMYNLVMYSWVDVVKGK